MGFQGLESFFLGGWLWFREFGVSGSWIYGVGVYGLEAVGVQGLGSFGFRGCCKGVFNLFLPLGSRSVRVG